MTETAAGVPGEDPAPAPEGFWDEEILAEIDRRRHPARSTALPPRVEAWRRHSVTGAVLTGIALGLQEVFQPPREPAAIVSQVPGDPPGPPGPLQVHLDPDDPAACTVVVRAWMID